MKEDDLSFYRRRHEEERDRQAKAAKPEVAAAHRLLAEMYAQRLDEAESPFLLRKEESQPQRNVEQHRPKLSLRLPVASEGER